MPPIEHLPNEILAHIFLMVRDANVQEEDGVRKMGWLRLAEVCRRWAAVVGETPWMWTSLHFYDGADSNVITTFLDRSKELTGLEVSLDFGQSRSPPSWSPALHNTSHTHRIGSLTIRWHWFQNQAVYLFIEELQANSVTTLTLVEDDSVPVPPEPVAATPVLNDAITLADEDRETWSSATDATTFVDEPPTTDDTATDEEELETGGYESDGKVAAGIVFRDHQSSDSEWDSGSEEEESTDGEAWDYHSNEGYDASEEEEDSEREEEEEEGESDDLEEGGEGADDDEEAVINVSSHWQLRSPDRDTDEEEISDQTSEEDYWFQSPRTSDGSDEISSDDGQPDMGVLQDVQSCLALPHLPALDSLAISGLLFVPEIHPANKPTLRSLTVLNTGNTGYPFASNDDGVLDILTGCISLERLTIDDFSPPISWPEDRRVSLPGLRTLTIRDDDRDTARELLAHLDLRKCVSVNLESMLERYVWNRGTDQPEVHRTLFRHALPTLREFSPATRQTFEAIVTPMALMFTADHGFFVRGCSQDTDGAPIDWHIGIDASDFDTRQPRALERHNALPVAIREFSTRATWRRDTVTDVEIHVAPCFEFAHVEGLKDAIDAFHNLRRLVVGGESTVCQYLDDLRSATTGWPGLEELGFCLHRSTETCYFKLAGLLGNLGDSAELPRRFVMHLPEAAFDPCSQAEEAAARAERCVDFHDLGPLFPQMDLDVLVIPHECETCHRRPPTAVYTDILTAR